MSNIYYGVEPYTGKIIQHFGIPGMKWGWTKDGKKTGAKEAMTEQERAQRRKDLIKKIGAGVGTAAAIGGTILAIKNRKKIGNFVQGLKNRRIDKPRTKIKTSIKKDINNTIKYHTNSLNKEAKWLLRRRESQKKILKNFHDYENSMKKNIPDYTPAKNIKEHLERSGQGFLYDVYFK